MKFTFKRNTKNRPVQSACAKISLLQRFDEVNLRLQHKCAHWLELKTTHLSRKSWIVMLFCFTIFTSGCSVYLIISSLSGNTTKSIIVSPITKPTNGVPFDDENMQLNTSISKVELDRIIRFRKYMDSLGRSPTGKTVHDSIVYSRPGLVDSLITLEHYYHSQFKK